MRRKNLGKLLFVASVAFASQSIAERGPQVVAPPCNSPSAAGFIDQNDLDWSGPWIFQTRNGKRTPFPWSGKRSSTGRGARDRNDSTPMRFDNGTVGALRVVPTECHTPAEPCATNDCCLDDSLWLVATDGSGRVVLHQHFYVPYGLLEAVPIDLIEGPGDEILLFSTPAHASPSVGFFMQIWQMRLRTLIDVSEEIFVANWLNFPITNWRANLEVNLSEQKPRTIAVSRVFGLLGCGLVSAEDRTALSQMPRSSVIAFDRLTHTYVSR